jgi:hypothetical protein
MPILDGHQTIKLLKEKVRRNELKLDNTKIIALSAISNE